jgi:two-component system cell cycle response regulator
MSAPRVVVADADPGVRRALAELLGEHGCEVVPAADGAAALAALEQHDAQLLLLAAALPDVDGYQFLERALAGERFRDLPVIVLAEAPAEEGAVRALGLGAADYVRAPARPRELVARVQARLRGGALLRAAREAQGRAQAELARVRQDAESRRTLVDILHEVTGDLSVPELFALLVRRAARALGVAHCAVILAPPGGTEGEVVAAAEDPALQAEPVALDRFPEVRAAFDTGLPVLVPDADTHPLYGPGRAVVGLDGHPAPLRSAIALPFSVDRGRHGVFLLRRTAGEPPFAEADLEFAEAAITAAVAVIQRAQVVEHARADNARLERLAQTDPLTQLLNRRALTERLQQEMERALRYDASLALLLVDLDHFKAVNDTHGHLVGDDALRDLARLLLDTVRTTDVVARYGGEEFLVLLPETDDTGAEGFAERIRQAVEAHRFEAAGAALRLTASLGVAVFPAPRVHTAEDLFVRADAALYRAKADGRNRVCT